MTISNGVDQNQTGQKCSCPHHKMVPIFITLLGLVFLLNALEVLANGVTAVVWPIIVILIGLQKMFSGKCKCC